MAQYPDLPINPYNKADMSELKDYVMTYHNLFEAYRKSRLGDGKFKSSAARFHSNMVWELKRLWDELESGTYRPLGYESFKVLEPKERVIHAPYYRDKIVQHMVNNILAPLFKQFYIKDSYACIEGKGNLKAVRKLQANYRAAHQRWNGQVYLVKADVKKFFYSIDRSILKDIIAKYIYCPWTLALVYTIIDSSLDFLGLPLGNLTSQLFSNILMNELDQYAVRELGAQYYLRYADDLFMLTNDREHAHYLLDQIKHNTTQRLNLTMHEGKSGVKRLTTNGLDGLGFKIYLNRIYVLSQNKRKIKHRLNRLQLEGLSDMALKDIEQSVNGWLTHSRIGQSEHFVEYLLTKHPFLYMGDNNLFRVHPI